MNSIRLIVGILGLQTVQSDIMPIRDGTDGNGCLVSAGYTWCQSSNSCIRQWDTPCKDNYLDCHDCLQRQRNGENIACPGTCDNVIIEDPCSLGCPPPVPCPAPPYMPNCEYIPPLADNCGCTVGCGTSRCNPLISQERETCGGFMAPGYSHTCADGLECANTMGPLIADAPGTCQPVCATFRDSWGNCVDENCLEWNDGCNTCSIVNNALTECTEEVCYVNPENSMCHLTSNIPVPTIPHNCASWYDGCNTCMVNNGQTTACTLMMCFRMGEPYCQSFNTEDLQVNDICYRFCEDGSQTFIDRSIECPINTVCMTDLTQNTIGFDNCGSMAKKCLIQKGH
jgi:hypothetical protein